MNTPRKNIILLDTHAILHRSFHALPNFSTKNGTPTGALYGLSTMLFKLIDEFNPEYIFACFDLPEKTFRHVAYEAYKGKRQKTDETLISQIEQSRQIFEAFQIPIYEKPGFEADDMLGTLAQILKKHKEYRIIIASGDMDTLQLVDDDQVVVFTLRKGILDTVLYDEKGVLERFGFPPVLLPDYKGLRGDPSDNIIGVKGIGEKTAETLIKTYGTIENMYKVLHENPDSLKKEKISERIILLLRDNEEEALFSKELATIKQDAPISFTFPDQPFSIEKNYQNIIDLFKQFEFVSLIKKVTQKFQPRASEAAHETREETIEDTYMKILLNKSVDEYIDHKTLEKEIKDAQMEFLWEEIERPLIPIVGGMHTHGILLDVSRLKEISILYHKELKVLEEKIYRFAGETFNINSPKQLGEVLFTKMKLVPEGKKRIKKTTTGQISTKESELEKLKNSHEIISCILEYRELQKLVSTYIDVLPTLVDTKNRIHATFNQLGTTTGRFSSENPNLQNIPIKTEKGKIIRSTFIAPPGSVLLAIDYSQIELRIAALLSQDPYLLKVFTDGKDVHAAVASRVFSVSEKEVTSEMRRQAKVINFGILYGMGVTALSQALGSDRKTAEEFHAAYFKEFPTIASYLESILTKARKLGYTETLFGRRRYFNELRSPIPYIRAQAERMAINAPIQGTATADCIKRAIVLIDRALKDLKIDSNVHLVLQVHDELVYEIEETVLEKAKKCIIENMKKVIPDEFLQGKQPVLLDVSVGVGKNWSETK